MVFGKEALGPRVAAVRPLDGYRLALQFGNGERRVFDATPLLAYKAFASLRDKVFFDMVSVGFGSIQWPGDIDYCADTLYLQSVPDSGVP
jgi:hypothetical protein